MQITIEAIFLFFFKSKEYIWHSANTKLKSSNVRLMQRDPIDSPTVR
jgi:hypothetical protein